ncbi:MAG: hypothetical protein IJ529_05230 [Alphaproteobacteria bacterium]|nr:hypothetical protein [Alphaproteobacteria bacterium]MBQ9235961.1 hypothetical protein [Alphaproteobacteria bacterium]
MIKAFGVSFLVMILLALAAWGDVFSLFVGNGVFYGALGLLVVALIAAYAVLGSPLKAIRDQKDDEQADE